MASVQCPVCSSKNTHVNEGKRARWVCLKCGSAGQISDDLGVVVFERAILDKVSQGSGRRLLRNRSQTG